MRYDGYKVILVSGLTLLNGYFHLLAIPMLILFIVVACDYVTGLVKAYINGSLSSKSGIKGILKKLCYFVGVIAASGVDYVLNSTILESDENITSPICLFVCIWLIINEIISIIENLSEMGVPIPQFIVKLINKLLVKSEKGESDND